MLRNQKNLALVHRVCFLNSSFAEENTVFKEYFFFLKHCFHHAFCKIGFILGYKRQSLTQVYFTNYFLASLHFGSVTWNSLRTGCDKELRNLLEMTEPGWGDRTWRREGAEETKWVALGLVLFWQSRLALITAICSMSNWCPFWA